MFPLNRTYSMKGSESGVNTRPATIRYEGCPPSLWYGTFKSQMSSNEKRPKGIIKTSFLKKLIILIRITGLKEMTSNCIPNGHVDLELFELSCESLLGLYQSPPYHLQTWLFQTAFCLQDCHFVPMHKLWNGYRKYDWIKENQKFRFYGHAFSI